MGPWDQAGGGGATQGGAGRGRPTSCTRARRLPGMAAWYQAAGGCSTSWGLARTWPAPVRRPTRRRERSGCGAGGTGGTLPRVPRPRRRPSHDLAGGAALFLAGNVAMRRKLGFGPVRVRIAAAVLALVTAVIGAFVAIEVQLAVVTALLAGMLVLERRQAAAGWMT